MSVHAHERIERLECDIDCRLADLWAEVANVETWDLELAAKFMRAAYGAGYAQALTEPERGLLCRTHGYRVPPRQQA